MGANDELTWLDATSQADLVRRREVKPEELVDAALERIDALNPSLNAVVTRIEPTRAADGPFAGVPFLVKDLVAEVAGTRFTEGSRFLRDNVSRHDQEIVRRWRRAGLVIVGKTNTPEFGLSPACEPVLFGPTHNPWNLERSTNGSSGGSAAAVAAGLVPMAHANDLAGSIRYPAAWCGVFGLKPTRARVPLGPEYGDAVSGFAVEHAVTRSVRDSAALLDAVAGAAAGDPYWAPPPARPFIEEVGADPGPLRIAMSRTPRGGQAVHPDYAAAAEATARLLGSLGHTVEEAVPDGLLDPDYEKGMGAVFPAFSAWVIGYWVRKLGRQPERDELEPQTRAFWEFGQRVSAGDYLLGVEALQRVSRKVAAFFDRYDVWVTPTLGGPPVPLGELSGTEDDPLRGNRKAGEFLMFDAELANITGNPAMSVPSGWDSEGMPIGMHFLGRFGDEATLLRLASQIEQARPWAERHPQMATAPARA